MTGSAARILAFALLGAGLGFGPASGQDAGPIQLRPGTPRPEPQIPPRDRPEPAIRVEPAQTLGAEAIGALTEAEGGFALTVWQGTPAETLNARLPRLAPRTGSPTLSAVLRRLLATTATMPQGANLTAARVRLLAALGALGEAETILSRSPGHAENPALAWAEAELALFAGDDARACEIVLRPASASTDRDFRMAEALCLAVAGARLEAQFALSLLREQAPAEDRPTLDLIESVAGGPKGRALPKDLRPVTMAALAAANETPATPQLAAAVPGVLRRIAEDESFKPELKLAAAVAAEAAGAISTTDLADILKAAQFSQAELTEPAAILSAGGAVALALTYQSAAAVTVPVARAEAVARLADFAPPLRASALRLSALLLEDVEPSTLLVWLGPVAARARVAGGAAEGDAWIRAARTDPAAASLMPLLWVADGVSPPAGAVRAWLDATGDTAAARAQAEAAYVLLVALGAKLNPRDWTGIASASHSGMAGGAPPDGATWFALEEAATAGRMGEAVILAASLLGSGDLAEAPLLAIGGAVSALRRIGLTNEARALAVEAAFARGL